MTDLKSFMALYGALAAAFPGVEVPGVTAQVFYLGLMDIPEELLAQAVAEWLAHGRRFPHIADLRELALAETYPLPAEAWGEVRRAFADFGRREKPVFSSPLITATVDDIGWEGMCLSDVADEPFIRSQFERAYRERVARETFDRTSLATALKRVDASPWLPNPDEA